MRSEVEHHFLLAPSEDPRVCESTQTGTDLDRPTAGVVQNSPFECPSVDIPWPTRHRCVYDCGPDEDEDHHWDETATLGARTDDDSSGDGAELHLCGGISINHEKVFNGRTW